MPSQTFSLNFISSHALCSFEGSSWHDTFSCCQQITWRLISLNPSAGAQLLRKSNVATEDVQCSKWTAYTTVFLHYTGHSHSEVTKGAIGSVSYPRTLQNVTCWSREPNQSDFHKQLDIVVFRKYDPKRNKYSICIASISIYFLVGSAHCWFFCHNWWEIWKRFFFKSLSLLTQWQL